MANQKLNKPHQRIGSKSNAHVGREFELATKRYFGTLGLELTRDIKIAIGVDELKKEHAFDLGCEKEKIFIECKTNRIE